MQGMTAKRCLLSGTERRQAQRGREDSAVRGGEKAGFPGSRSICPGRGSWQRRQKSIAGRRNSRNRGTEMGKEDGLIPNPPQ